MKPQTSYRYRWIKVQRYGVANAIYCYPYGGRCRLVSFYILIHYSTEPIHLVLQHLRIVLFES